MKRYNLLKIIPVLLAFGMLPDCFAQVLFTDSNLPIILINTNGQTIEDEPKINCDMGIISNEDGNRNHILAPYNDYNGRIGIEIRGSTSQQYPKKSYGIETRDSLGNNLNVSLLGMPKENDWVLYGAYPDKSLMRNEITYALFAQMQPWSPRYVYCELVVDGEYMGLYTLIEKVKRDKDRIDIEKLSPADNEGDALTGGYVIKIDKPTGSSSTPWHSAHQDNLKFLYHDPKYQELSFTQRNYIKDYVSNFEVAVYSPGFVNTPLGLGYRSFINVESFIDFFLMQELGRTVDGYRSSSFMYKDRDSKGGKLTCGPMWDFNLSYGNADYCEAYKTTGWQYNFADVCENRFDVMPPNWWARLLEDKAFADSLKCRWIDLRSTILSTKAINHWIDSTALYLTEAQERNFTKWPILGEYVNWNHFVGTTFQEEVDYLKWWFETRSEYLDEHLPGTCVNDEPQENDPPDDMPENNITFYPNPTSGVLLSNITLGEEAAIALFNLEGRPVSFYLSDDKIDLSHLPKGMYLVRVNGQYIKVVKI